MSGEASATESSTTAMERSNIMRETEELCNCGKVATLRKAWTNANPGRRFYGCGAGCKSGDRWRSVCNYFRWRDVETQNVWQKIALLEARNLIKAQKQELERIQELQSSGSETQEKGSEERIPDLVAELKKENERLKREINASLEKEQSLRQVLIISWIGFVCGVATIVHGLK